MLVWAHWVWFATPHATLAYLALRDRERFARAAVLTYAVFDLGVDRLLAGADRAAVVRRASAAAPARARSRVRRLMVEYGESFWRNGWAPLYSVLGGNPLAAMPSLHFATSAMAASVLLGSNQPVYRTRR